MSPPQQRIAIIGDSALDIFIEESSERFARYKSGMSVEELLTVNRRVEDGETKGPVYRRLGGPVLTVGQYLAGRDDTSQNSLPFKVSAVTLLGTDKFSTAYRQTLETLGIELDEERIFEGDISHCAYVYVAGEASRQISAWEDNVGRSFKDIQLNRHFLAAQDVIVLPITEPSVAKKAAEIYREVRKDGTLVYNPGPYLQDTRYEFKTSGFEDIIRYTTILVVNRVEKEILKKNMGLRSILDIFEEYPSLEIFISTMDKEGSLIFTRDPKNRNSKLLHSKQYPSEEELKIENPTGAGDAFLGTFLRFFLGRDYDVKDAHGKARASAERQLTQKGATDADIIRTGVLPSFDGSFGRYTFSDRALAGK